MKVFLSWSGSRSRLLAEALHEFLGDVVHAVQPFVSSADLEPGERWTERLTQELEDTSFGIVCLTKENMASQWLLFEAGALSRSLDRGRVCPYLLDVKASSLKGPLSQFQCTLATRKDTFTLVRTLNKHLPFGVLSDARLQRGFESAWPRLQDRLTQIPPPEEVDQTARSEFDLLEEIVGHVRQLRFGRTAYKSSERETFTRRTGWPTATSDAGEMQRFFRDVLLPKAERRAWKEYQGISLSDEQTTLRERTLTLAENAAREHGLWEEWRQWRGKVD
jgi:TIR domain-containing protein